MSRAKWFSVWLVFIVGQNVYAQGPESISGNKLLEQCRIVKQLDGIPWGWKVTNNNDESIYCLSYLDSLKDNPEKYVSHGTQNKRYCLPEKIRLERLAIIYVDYADRNPQQLRTASADSYAVNAFADAFPCQ